MKLTTPADKNGTWFWSSGFADPDQCLAVHHSQRREGVWKIVSVDPEYVSQLKQFDKNHL